MYKGEVHRCLEGVELQEKLRLDYHVTNEEYRSEHSTEGELRAYFTPDKEVVRARSNPPSNFGETLVQKVIGEKKFFGNGYPGTKFFVGITRVPPITQRDEQFQEGVSQQDFTVNGIPPNGTIAIDGDWDLDRARDSLSNNEIKTTSREYEIHEMPTGQLPLLVRAELHRDAREYIESIPPANDKRDEQNEVYNPDPKEFEGLAALVFRVEYKGDSPELEVAAGNRTVDIENLRIEMQSTFPDIVFLPEKGSTYNPEKKRIEWREQPPLSADNIYRYSICGQMEEILGLGRISATLRVKILNTTLTGTQIFGLYDQTGKQLPSDIGRKTHLVTITGDIEIDPTALRKEVRKVMNATIRLNDTPFDAFDRLETVCNREGITITKFKEPNNPEPVPEQKNVFEFTKGEKGDGDDEPGELEVKREYGDQGVVYAHIWVYGQYTSMTRNREVSQFPELPDRDRTERRLVRADEGGLETRGKSTVDIKARSVNSELNSKFVETIQEGMVGGVE